MMRRIEAAIAVILLAETYWMLPVSTPDALDWILFVGLLVYAAYFIYYTVMQRK